jgi:hypothetical protein
MRLATTSRQRQALIPEFGKKRGAYLLKIFAFVLRNPLAPLLGAKEVSIADINQWLSNLEDTMVPENKRSDRGHSANEEVRNLRLGICKPLPN